MILYPECYAEMIDTLQHFLSDAYEQCSIMNEAAELLAASRDYHPEDIRKANDLRNKVQQIETALEKIYPIIKQLDDLRCVIETIHEAE